MKRELQFDDPFAPILQVTNQRFLHDVEVGYLLLKSLAIDAIGCRQSTINVRPQRWTGNGLLKTLEFVSLIGQLTPQVGHEAGLRVLSFCVSSAELSFQLLHVGGTQVALE